MEFCLRFCMFLNKYLIADGVSNSYGTRTSQDVAKGSKFKRVLHFKTADDWFDYNDLATHLNRYVGKCLDHFTFYADVFL